MVLVTGATGILGRVIVLELLKRGESVLAAKRKTGNLQEVRNSFKFYTENPDELFSKIKWIDVDFTDIFSLKNALNGVDEVYHCSAKVSFHPSDKQEMFHTNIEGTKNLLYACEDSSVKKFLFVSSIAVLDGVNENGFLDEESDYNSKLNHSAYAVSKHFSEMEVWRTSAEGLSVAIINPGIIIGSGNWNESSGALFKTLENNNFTFSGETGYVDVRDVAKIAVAIMEENIFGERFVLVSENWKYWQIANYIRKKLNKAAPKILSANLLKAGTVFSALLGWLIPPLKYAEKANIDAVTGSTAYSSEKIIERIGYQFIPVNESLDFHFNNYLQDQNRSEICLKDEKK